MKILIAFLILLCTISCTEECKQQKAIQVQIKKEQEQKIKSGDASFQETVSGRFENPRIKEYTYKKHKYIWFEKTNERGDFGYGYAGVVHSPDCPCQKEIK